MLHIAYSEANCGVNFLVAVCSWAVSQPLWAVAATLKGQEGVICSFSKYMNSNHTPGTVLGAEKQRTPHL